MAMTVDLGLNKPETIYSTEPVVGPNNYFVRDGAVNPARTLEERRAFLGCFHLSSAISMCSRDMYPIKYNGYAEICCNVIAEANEYPTDTYLVQLTRLHQIAEKISYSLGHDELGYSPGAIAPIGAVVRALEAELAEIKSSLPLHIPQAAALLVHFHAIELNLYEVALNDNVTSVKYGNYPLGRLNLLFGCLTATKACYDAFNTITPAAFVITPYTTWSLFGRSLVMLSKLSLFTGEGWDTDYVRQVLAFNDAVDSMARKFEQAIMLSQSDNEQQISHTEVPHVFTIMPQKMQAMKAGHERKRQAQMKQSAAAQSSSVGSDVDLIDATFCGGAATMFEFMIDDFWQQSS